MTASLRSILFGLVALLAVGSCKSKQRTELVVEVGSNLAVPVELDKVDLAITSNGTTQHTPYSLVSDYQLPVLVGIVEASDGAGTITIVATGYLNNSPIVAETASLSFVEGKSMLLKLFLAAECRMDPCTDDPTTTCTKGGVCVSKVRTPSELTPYVPALPASTGGIVGRPDSGADQDGLGGIGGGTGGAGGSGGNIGTGDGGTSGTGGAPAIGGATARGGAPGTGGIVGSGGSNGNGGSNGTGGASSGGASGGSNGSGGEVGTGGASSGGASGGSSTAISTGGSTSSSGSCGTTDGTYNENTTFGTTGATDPYKLNNWGTWGNGTGPTLTQTTTGPSGLDCGSGCAMLTIDFSDGTAQYSAGAFEEYFGPAGDSTPNLLNETITAKIAVEVAKASGANSDVPIYISLFGQDTYATTNGVDNMWSDDLGQASSFDTASGWHTVTFKVVDANVPSWNPTRTVCASDLHAMGFTIQNYAAIDGSNGAVVTLYVQSVAIGSSGGSGGAGGGSTAGGDMISDFESTPGKADMDKNGGRTGYWYVYFPSSDTSTTPASGMTISPALVNGAPIDSASSDTGHALHVKGSGYDGSSTNYAGFGANFTPDNPYDKKSAAYDVSAYSGITFKVKSGSGTLPPTFFEVLAKENQPTTWGGNLDPSTSGPDNSIGLYNTRGWMLTTPWLAANISSTWQTFTIPFGQLIPRHLCDATACGTSASVCQPPALNPKDVLGIQFSYYAGEKGWPNGIGTPGTFDIWVDDVAFTTGPVAVQTLSGFPAAKPYDMGSCKLPAGPSANPAYLAPAYLQWKSTFVKGGKVIRPENQNDTVSEGIAYGMLISANMHDKTTFDSLYGTWKANKTAGTLMTWCLGSGGGSTGTACSTSGGSATDADEDAAFALLQADKIFGGGYKADALQMIKDIWAGDIDSATKLPKGGSNYGSPSSAVTNPSYFAPAYYAAFKAAGDGNDWDGVISAVYKAINTSLAGTNSNGLYAAWCSGTCSAIAKNNDDTDVLYQYDSHRIPMRIGLDVCFGGAHASDAKTYVGKTTSFFATNANAGKNGIGRIFDVYDPNTSNVATSGVTPANNSASIIGTAGVGAMADGSNQQFIEDAFQATFDIVSRGSLDTTDTSAGAKTPYSYFNATVGMLTLLMMTGNFSH